MNRLACLDRGGLMSESYDRIRARATESAGTPPETLDDHDRIAAMRQLGYLTSEDSEHSERIVRGCTWSITAPAGWDRSESETHTVGAA